MLNRIKHFIHSRFLYFNSFDDQVEMTWLYFLKKYLLVICPTTASLTLFIIYRFDGNFGAIKLFADNPFWNMFSDVINEAFFIVAIVLTVSVIALIDYLVSIPPFLLLNIKNRPDIRRILLAYSYQFVVVYAFGAIFFGAMILYHTYGESVAYLAIVPIGIATLLSWHLLEYISLRRVEYTRSLFKSKKELWIYRLTKGGLLLTAVVVLAP